MLRGNNPLQDHDYEDEPFASSEFSVLMAPPRESVTFQATTRLQRITDGLETLRAIARRKNFGAGELVYDIRNESRGLGDELSIGHIRDANDVDHFSVILWRDVLVCRDIQSMRDADRITVESLRTCLAPMTEAQIRQQIDEMLPDQKAGMVDMQGKRFRCAPLAHSVRENLSIVAFDESEQYAFGVHTLRNFSYLADLERKNAFLTNEGNCSNHSLQLREANFVCNRAEELLRIGNDLLAC